MGSDYTTADLYTDGYLIRRNHIASGTITWYQEYTYNTNGLVATYTVTQNGTVDKQEYNYNNADKLIKTLFYKNGVAKYQVTYDYTNGIITPTTENFSTGVITTGTYFYYVNTGGVIYKLRDLTSGTEEIYEIQYEGYNPVSAYDYSQNMDFSFTFDNTHDYSLLGIHDGNGVFKANAILREDWLFDNEAIFATKYILSREILYNEGETWYSENHNYTFAENGKPLTDKVYKNSELAIETEYIYE